MRRPPLPALLAAAAILSACADPALLGGPGANESGPPRLENGFTLSAPGGIDGREPLRPNGDQPALRGGTVIEGPPGTPLAPPFSGGTGALAP